MVVGIEARGFVFSAPVAHGLGAGLVPIRKPGKLPFDVDSISYELEYGGGTLEIHSDALRPGTRCLIVDDVLATGGTARPPRASCVERQGGDLVGYRVPDRVGVPRRPGQAGRRRARPRH